MIKSYLKIATRRIPVLFVSEKRTECRDTRGLFIGSWWVRFIWSQSGLSTHKKTALDIVSGLNTPTYSDKVLWQLVFLFPWLFAYLTTH